MSTKPIDPKVEAVMKAAQWRPLEEFKPIGDEKYSEYTRQIQLLRENLVEDILSGAGPDIVSLILQEVYMKAILRLEQPASLNLDETEPKALAKVTSDILAIEDGIRRVEFGAPLPKQKHLKKKPENNEQSGGAGIV